MTKSLTYMTLDELYAEQRRLVELPCDAQNESRYEAVMQEIDIMEKEMIL